MSQTVSERSVVDALYRISSLVGATDEPGEALQLILEEIVSVLDATSASVALVNPDSHQLEIESSVGLPPEAADLRLAVGEGVTGWVALHGRPLRVDNVDSDPRYVAAGRSIRSELAVPMEEQGMVIGVVNVDSTRIGAFSGEDVKILSLLTVEATRVVSRLWLIRKLRSKATQLEALIGVGSELVLQRDREGLTRSLTRATREIMQCPLSALFLVDETGSALRLAALSGGTQTEDYEEELAFEESAMGTAVHFRKQIEVFDLRRTEEHHFIPLILREGLVSLLSTPIVLEGEAIGVLNAYTTSPHRFNNSEKAILQSLADLGSLALQNLRLYERVFQSEETLRRNERLTTLGLLAAEIAHEIRNPLTVLELLFQSLDLQFPDDDPRQRDVTVISEKLHQLDEIVTRVLNFGKSSEGLHSRWELSEMIRDTLHLVRLKLAQSRIEVSYEAGGAPLVIDSSKGQIQQALLNLILNATQAMPDGGTIAIRSYREDEDRGARAVVEIADSGHGIPVKMRGRIFDSFLSGRSNGTGLGLTIVKRILRSHRGDIEAVSTSTSGTTMRFWVPLA